MTINRSKGLGTSTAEAVAAKILPRMCAKVHVKWALYLTREECHGGSVDPGVVGCGGHSGEIVLSLGGGYPGAGQLPIVHLDLIPLHRSFHLHQGIRCYLYTNFQAAKKLGIKKSVIATWINAELYSINVALSGRWS